MSKFEDLLNEVEAIERLQNIITEAVAKGIDNERKRVNLEYIVENAIIARHNQAIQEDDQLFTREQLVRFGNQILTHRFQLLDIFLLSSPNDNAKETHLMHERLREWIKIEVTHADVENFISPYHALAEDHTRPAFPRIADLDRFTAEEIENMLTTQLDIAKDQVETLIWPKNDDVELDGPPY